MIADLGPKDAADFLISFRSEVSTLWNIFIVVALGLVSVAYSQKAPGDRLRIALVVAFAVFAIGNLFSVLSAHSFALALHERLRSESFAGLLARDFGALRMSPNWLVAAYHIVLDVVVVAALWTKRSPKSDVRAD